MKPQRPAPAARPKQIASDEMIGRLLGAIRGQFCGDLSAKEWYQHTGFLKAKVLLWPAAFMAGRGFTVSEARYEQIMRAILAEIKQHATTAPIRYWPGYLMKCVQDHWKHHWEDYYEEAKAARNIAETALVNFGKAQEVDRGVEALAAAHRVLAGGRKRSGKPVRKEQLSLL